MPNRLLIGFYILLSVLWLAGCSQNAPMGQYGFKKKEPFITSQERHNATMKSYYALGKTYSPTYIEVGDTMSGVASWYGPDFHGKYTSSGEIYDMYDFTAAHKTWPMDTVVKITNLDNGKTQIARINDRGPFKDDRIIDCSYATGKALGLDKTGLANVKIEAISFNSRPVKPIIDTQVNSNMAYNSPKRILLDNFGIQVGAFRIEQGALKTKDRYASLDLKHKSVVKRFDTADGRALYRVFVMGFVSEDEARNYMAYHGITDAVIIRG
ncbi:MAG: septal ring lytic transglycosylase RlpA family protein [Sulfurovaceae bacterium]|nr:septal ring lytic transglycosylase RlpA family protein [Sulfurovaceae bacterium]